MYVVKTKEPNFWEPSSLELEHNHETVYHTNMNLIQWDRHLTEEARNLIKTINVSSVGPTFKFNNEHL